MMKKVLVTGGNTGIGFALCKQLVTEHNCHVLLGARSQEKGEAAVEKIKEIANDKSGNIELVLIDVSKDESVTNAAKSVAEKCKSEKLYAIVNNAGLGLAHGVSTEDILNVNVFGVKRVTDAFLPILDEKEGRIVNVGSGVGPGFVKNLSEEKKKQYSNPMTWETIKELAKSDLEKCGYSGYGISKALVATYTMQLTVDHPNIRSYVLSPGFIETNMTKGYGASLTPEEGTVSLKHCLFADIPKELNGSFWGSDAKRSPFHKPRDPGTPEWDGLW